jgi:hypothetical protein
MIVFALLVGARQELLTSIASVAICVGIIWLGSAKGTVSSAQEELSHLPDCYLPQPLM